MNPNPKPSEENSPKVTLETGQTVPLEHFNLGTIPPPTPEEQKVIEALSEAAKEKASEKKREQEVSQQEGRVITLQKKKTEKSWFKNSLMALGFFAAGAAGAQTTQTEGKDIVKNTQAKEIKVSGSERVASGKSAPFKMGLEFYKGGKTREGSITPTGKLNAFENGKYSEEEVYDFAIKHGLRTNSNKDFQEDLFNIPGIKEKVLKEYGQTAAGTLLDGILGARVEFAMEEVEKGGSYGGGLHIEPTPETNPEIPPVLENIPPTLESADNVKVFFDLSSSMSDEKAKMAKELKSINQTKPFEIIGFAETAEATFTANSSDEAAEKILKLPESKSGKELAANVSIKKLLEKNEFSFNPTENNLAIWNTDEALQLEPDEITELEKLAQEQNITFDIRIKTKQGVEHLTLKDVRTIYDTHYKQKTEESISRITKKIDELTKEIKTQGISKEDKEIKQGILKNYEKNLEKTISIEITGLEKR